MGGEVRLDDSGAVRPPIPPVTEVLRCRRSGDTGTASGRRFSRRDYRAAADVLSCRRTAIYIKNSPDLATIFHSGSVLAREKPS